MEGNYSMSRLSAGVYRVDITPPVGISMVGYYARDGVSAGVERPLTATALVLTTETSRVAIVACDLIFIQNPAIDQIRHRIAEAIGTTSDCVLINCSHTHCGPTLPGFTFESETQRAMQGAYLNHLRHVLTGCAYAASQRPRPARIGFDRGSARIGINRREKDEDGKVVLGENPDGPLDPDVPVVRVDDTDGRPLAALFSYACHTVTMGPKCLMLSPDFAGPARQVIEDATGATALFLQSAAGNVNPISGIGTTEDDTDNMTRVGQTLGAEALQAMLRIRTHQKRGPRVLFPSLSRNFTYPYVPIEDGESEIIATSEIVGLPTMALPSLEEARKILETREQSFEQARKEGWPEYRLAGLGRFRDWAKVLHRTVESGARHVSIPLVLQSIRINDIVIAAAAGETLVELGLGVKQRSPFPNTIFLGYSNGCIGYISPADAYPPEGWSPWETYSIPDMIFQSYQLPMALAPESGQMVIDRSVALLSRLARTTSMA
jgi:neutral ceramidase